MADGVNSETQGMENGDPYALVLWNGSGSQLVWVRPSYESALRTLRSWFAIELVEYSELNDAISQYPDPAVMSYEEISKWVRDQDLGWNMLLLPVNTPSDPLRAFLDDGLKCYPVAEQERIRRSVLSAVEWVFGG